MRKILGSTIVTTGLAIFSMLFGAGNLMFPLRAGLSSGQHIGWGTLGFISTAIFLPVIGLVGIILFNGDYRAFFNRVGKKTGGFIVLCCMATIGPCVAMPRIVTLSYEMIRPFLPAHLNLFTFSLIFLGITYLATVKESRLLDLLGKIVSPALLISLGIILVKGFISPAAPLETLDLTAWRVFTSELVYGYKTLDLLGTIFFSAIVLSLLKDKMVGERQSIKHLAATALKAGALGSALLGLVYIGMTFLGATHGQGMLHVNEGELFSAISLNVLGTSGAIIVATAVLMACFSTITALAVVVAEYIQKEISNNTIPYEKSLAGVLCATLVPSNFGLASILKASEPFIMVCYPVIITITLCNIAHKLFGFRPIKLPALATLLISLGAFLWPY